MLHAVNNYFTSSAFAVNLRYGCDGNLGSGKLVDKCGVCGGLNECVGCDGGPSTMRYDSCGVCGGDNRFASV